MRYAIIENGVVINVVEADAGFAVTQGWIEAGSAGVGWSYDGEGFSPPALWATLEEAKAARLAELAAYRWQIECGGIVRNGAAIATDDRSQAKISGALQLVQDDPQVVIDWKADNGWVQLDATAVTYIAREIGLHVQAAFSREKALAAAINACTTVAEVAAVDITTGWPE